MPPSVLHRIEDRINSLVLCANLYLIMNELTLNLWCEFYELVFCKKVLKLVL